MPKPIICLSEPLCQFADAFRDCFSRRQWPYFVIVLLGLIECEERRTLSGLRRTIAEQVSVSGLSRFLSQWPWSAEAVAATWLKRFREQMVDTVQADHARQRAERPLRRGRPKTTVVTGYVSLDDSVHVKPKGRKMAGLGRHYASTEKRTVSGHCLFTGLYSLLGRRCPLLPRLYRQQVVCEREGVAFRSKIDLAVETIEQFVSVPDTHTHLLIDTWYHCRAVRRTAQRRGWDVSGGLKSNRTLRLIADDGTRRWLSMSEYAASLSPQDWRETTWPTQRGSYTSTCSRRSARTRRRCWRPDQRVGRAVGRRLFAGLAPLMSATAIVRWTLLACLFGRAPFTPTPPSRGAHRRNLLRCCASAPLGRLTTIMFEGY
ncbi:MAG: transposase [Anaerolineae bacterium]